MTDNFRSDRGHDPIAELARLIAQLILSGDGGPARIASTRRPTRMAMMNRPGFRLRPSCRPI